MLGVIFYTFILSFASGIFLRSFFEIDPPVVLCLLWLCLILGLWWRRQTSEISKMHLLVMTIFILGVSLGVCRMNIADSGQGASMLKQHLEQKITIQGKIIREPEITNNAKKIVIDVNGELVLVSVDRSTLVDYGDTVKVKGKLEAPESFETEFGRTFNYPGYLAVRGIYYTMSFAKLEEQIADGGNPVLHFLFGVKKSFISNISLAIPEPAVALGIGLLLGVKQSLGDDLESNFRTTGIIHIVVLSGANIMLVVIFVMYLFTFFFDVRTRVLCGVLAIIAFALLVGLSATVVRACIMAILGLLALAVGRKYAVMRALMFAGFCMLLWNPLLLVFDVGFQLSFMATLGLVVILPQLESFLGTSPLWGKFREFLLATVSTQIAVLPLLLYHIGQFSVVAVVVNMLVLPMVPVAMLLTFVTGVLGYVSSTLSSLLGVLAYFSLSYIIVLAEWFASLPFAAFTVPEFSFYWVVLEYLFLGVGIYYKAEKVLSAENMAISTNKTSEQIALWTIVAEDSNEMKNGWSQSDQPNPDTKTPVFFR